MRDARPPLGVQILSISCSFRENLACSRPPWRVHAPPSGKSGSATGNDIYCSFIYVRRTGFVMKETIRRVVNVADELLWSLRSIVRWKEKPYHRTLYIFACCSRSCWNKATRYLFVDAEYSIINQFYASINQCIAKFCHGRYSLKTE